MLAGPDGAANRCIDPYLAEKSQTTQTYRQECSDRYMDLCMTYALLPFS